MKLDDPLNPEISVIVCSYNLRRFLCSTIDTILAQKDIELEIIVIDGASTDGTASELPTIKGITWISEPDLGYADAFLKGLRLAKAKYITQCAISDGYLDDYWLHKAVAYLESNQEITAVWGFPRGMSESGELGQVSYLELFNSEPLHGAAFFEYWLSTGFWMPEGNLVAHRHAFDYCFPVEAIENKQIDCWLEFNYRFHSAGFLAGCIKDVVSYGRAHVDSIGQSSAKNGLGKIWTTEYEKRLKKFRRRLLIRGSTHIFTSPDGRPKLERAQDGLLRGLAKYLKIRFAIFFAGW